MRVPADATKRRMVIGPRNVRGGRNFYMSTSKKAQSFSGQAACSQRLGLKRPIIISARKLAARKNHPDSLKDTLPGSCNRSKARPQVPPIPASIHWDWRSSQSDQPPLPLPLLASRTQSPPAVHWSKSPPCSNGTRTGPAPNTSTQQALSTSAPPFLPCPVPR